MGFYKPLTTATEAACRMPKVGGCLHCQGRVEIMKCMKRSFSKRFLGRGAVFTMALLFSIARPSTGAAQEAKAPVGPGKILVHSKFGGQIFGFDIDQNGSEGVLSEAQDISGGKVLAAVETFDQATGKILNVVSKVASKDDFLTLGIAGTSVGLVEREHVTGIFVTKRIYEEINPLSTNKFTGTWKAPLAADQIIIGVSRTQSTPTTAILAFDNNNTFQT